MSGLGHVLLGMNAHVNYDLPQALLTVISDTDFDDRPLMASRQRDHERIHADLASRAAAEDRVAGLGSLSVPHAHTSGYLAQLPVVALSLSRCWRQNGSHVRRDVSVGGLAAARAGRPSDGSDLLTSWPWRRTWRPSLDRRGET
jgi:hypothetical protein